MVQVGQCQGFRFDARRTFPCMPQGTDAGFPHVSLLSDTVQVWVEYCLVSACIQTLSPVILSN